MMKQFVKPLAYDPAKGICTVLVLALAGCAGRPPQPVAVVQPQDRYMDCTAIQAEILANNKTIQGLGSEEGSKVAQNVAAGVAGLFIWPLWFAMDFQGAAGKEEAALQSRQEYLASLALQRGCASPPSAQTVAAAPAASATAALSVAPPPPTIIVPAPVTPPQATMPMTPCGEDRPCMVQGTTGS
jgi:hypothetical protein